MNRRIFIALMATVLCGCASAPKWQSQAFDFSVPTAPPSPAASDQIVALSRVSISPAFQSRSFTYRTAENVYAQDPYAEFVIPPERALAEFIRAELRASGAFGRVLDPGSGLAPTLLMEVYIDELYGDFRNPSHPVGTMGIHFLCYEVKEGVPGKIVVDRVCARQTPLARKTPGALIAAWEADLREIMNEITAEYARNMKGSP